jgi:hypothetical protein
MNLLRFFRRRRHDTDLAHEIAAQREAERAENLARSFSPDEAARLASSSAPSAACTKMFGTRTHSASSKASSAISNMRCARSPAHLVSRS